MRQRLYTGGWNKMRSIAFGIALLFLILPSVRCLAGGGSQDAAEGVYGYVKDESGSPVVSTEVSIFDGFTIHNAETDSNGRYRISRLPVSTGRYAVIFFSRDGYIPEASNLKVHDKGAIEYSPVLKKAKTSNAGFVIGAVYQPVRGGKIQFVSGIYGFGEKRQVFLERDGEVIKKETDREGHFLFEVPPGRYTLSGEGVRERIEVDVVEGQTVIRNLRSGIVLID